MTPFDGGTFTDLLGVRFEPGDRLGDPYRFGTEVVHDPSDSPQRCRADAEPADVIADRVLRAYGYEHGAATGRTLALYASPTGTQIDWGGLLTSRSGSPVMVVCDDDSAIVGAVTKTWPATFIKSCEHHLRETVRKKMKGYGHTTFGHPQMEALNDAFKSPAGWDTFKAGASGVIVQAWINSHDTAITAQVAARSVLPGHHSTGAIEQILQDVREFMEPRSFCYRNAERTNLMLELVRLSKNRNDDPVRYAAAIRAHLDQHDGQLGPQGSIRDPRGVYSLRIWDPSITRGARRTSSL